ncbi:hypothetical protein, partial [Arabidopsis thaliana]
SSSSPPFCSGGRRKELRDKEITSKSDDTQASYVLGSKFVDPTRVLQLSWLPRNVCFTASNFRGLKQFGMYRVFLYRGFLSEEECDHLISLGKETTEVYSVDADGKTQLDPVVAGIEEKVSAWTFLPGGLFSCGQTAGLCFSLDAHFSENGGSIKVRSYTSEKSGKKLDYFGEEPSSVLHESLLATVVLYLSNTTQGGELLFPNSEVKPKNSCLEGGNILRPVKGNAILFFTRLLNASLDGKSTHLRCPVVKGELLVATKLIYAKKQARIEESGECSDEDENCGRWAKLGECKKNPVYMIGSPDYYGTCRKSCNAC